MKLLKITFLWNICFLMSLSSWASDSVSGYDVTVFDNSPEQLNQDRTAAEKFRLKLKTIEGDMRDLSVFDDETFDLVFNPCSTAFVMNSATLATRSIFS